MWKVLRHGGRRTDSLRTVFEGEETKARDVYEKISTNIRQGVVELVNPDGYIVKRAWAPRLKRIW